MNTVFYRFDPRANEISASLASVKGEIIKRFIESPWEYLKWYLFGKPVMLFSWDVFRYGIIRYKTTKTPTRLQTPEKTD